MRRHRSLKSSTCTEHVAVDAAEISAKVKVFYPGRSALDGKTTWTEVSRRHSRPLDPAEGLNMVK
jgi:hypothetical protein